MNIVVTDGYTLNPGDLSWDEIAILGKLTVYDRTPEDLIVERCKEANVVLTNKVPFSKQTLSHLPALKLISMLATGFNVIDTVAAKENNVIVCNAPAYGTDSVAQHVFALLLEFTNHVGKNAASTAAGKWQQAADWCYTEGPVMELAGKTFGVVGYGSIGRKAAAIASAFGMKVLFASRTQKVAEIGRQVLIENLFRECDVISLHCPLTPANQGFVNRSIFATMKSSAILINTARGGFINEQELADALNEGVIAGAALDVLSTEPPSNSNPLLTAKNCMITPHNAWISKEARERIMAITASNIVDFLSGNPVNIVN